MKDRVLSVFTKFEKADTTKAARVINPPNSRYGLMLGKWLKANEHKYFQSINAVWGARTKHTVFKGIDIYEAAETMRSKWDRFADPVAVGIDARKLDAHVSVPALKYEHSFYNDVFQDPELAEILKWQLTSKSVGYVIDGKVEASFPGTRCSGDLNTSLGNCILVCAMVWAFVEGLCIDCELVNNGDDCVVIMERADLERFLAELEEWFVERGFRMVVENPVDEFEQIVFCQARPVCSGGIWRMVRDPFTCLKKDPVCLRPLSSAKSFAKWRGAVGRGGLSLTSGIPVLQAFYACLMRGTRQCTRRYFTNVVCQGNSMLERGANLDAHQELVQPGTRDSFHAAFGISPAEQRAMEAYYDRTQLSDVSRKNGEVFTAIALIDQASLLFDD